MVQKGFKNTTDYCDESERVQELHKCDGTELAQEQSVMDQRGFRTTVNGCDGSEEVQEHNK